MFIKIFLFNNKINIIFKSYCFDGICGSRNQQCKYLWGITGENSVPECYTFNKNGYQSGNCGYDLNTRRFLRCSEKYKNFLI